MDAGKRFSSCIVPKCEGGSLYFYSLPHIETPKKQNSPEKRGKERGAEGNV